MDVGAGGFFLFLTCHVNVLLVGAFTSAQVTAAAKATGLDATESGGRELFLQIRLCSLESIGNAYRSWKAAADSSSLHAA